MEHASHLVHVLLRARFQSVEPHGSVRKSRAPLLAHCSFTKEQSGDVKVPASFGRHAANGTAAALPTPFRPTQWPCQPSSSTLPEPPGALTRPRPPRRSMPRRIPGREREIKLNLKITDAAGAPAPLFYEYIGLCAGAHFINEREDFSTKTFLDTIHYTTQRQRSWSHNTVKAFVREDTT